jgi:carboxymethylenebutenolidase
MAMRMRGRKVAAILAILATSLPAAAQDKPAFVEIRQSEASFKSEGQPIYVELFQPEAPGKYPAAIVLHGDDGMLSGRYPYVHIAAGVARAGNVALLVRYFDRTDATVTRYWTQAQKFAAWRQVVADALTYAATLPDVDADRIGLVGVSLGASLALAIATQDARVHAVVDYYGELPDDYAARLRKMPPVLILHGEKDSVVKVDAAYRLEALLKKNQVPHEMKIYPGAGHGFQRGDVADALARTIAFLRQHL